MCFSSQLATSELAGHGDRRNWRAEAGASQRRCGTVLGGAGASADWHGSNWKLSLAGGPAGRTRPRVVDRRRGTDSSQLCAAAEDGQARRSAHSEAAGGRAISPHLDAVERGARSTAVTAAPLQTGDSAGAGEERTATPVPESGSAAQAQAVESGGAAGAAGVAVEAVGSATAGRCST